MKDTYDRTNKLIETETLSSLRSDIKLAESLGYTLDKISWDAYNYQGKKGIIYYAFVSRPVRASDYEIEL